MTESNDDKIKEYESRIEELEKELEEAKKDDSLDSIKANYEKVITEKDAKIKELEESAEKNQQKVDATLTDLNKEVEERLKQTQAYQDMEKKLHEMEVERAETVVDTYIAKGVLLPAQRESAVKLCLNDNDTFMNLYKDAQPIVQVKEQKSKKINADITRLRDYFKN